MDPIFNFSIRVNDCRSIFSVSFAIVVVNLCAIFSCGNACEVFRYLRVPTYLYCIHVLSLTNKYWCGLTNSWISLVFCGLSLLFPYQRVLGLNRCISGSWMLARKVIDNRNLLVHLFSLFHSPGL